MRRALVGLTAVSVGTACYLYNKPIEKFTPSVVLQPNYNFVNTISADEKVPYVGLPGTKYERTFMMVKPDGVQVGFF